MNTQLTILLDAKDSLQDLLRRKGFSQGEMTPVFPRCIYCSLEIFYVDVYGSTILGAHLDLFERPTNLYFIYQQRLKPIRSFDTFSRTMWNHTGFIKADLMECVYCSETIP